MQEIADEAGINKAMLHYYLKQTTSFEAVFMNVFNQLSPQINTLFNSDDPFLKNNKVHLRLHHIRHRQRIYRRFMIQEMNNNPECHEVSKPRSQT
jgi:AcrR family transcriptional regulator